MRNLESLEQQALFRWAALSVNKYPQLMLLHAIPNHGKRHIATAVRLKAEGVRPGLPDVCLPTPNKHYHGLYIELKVGKNKPTDVQKWWHERLAEQGYMISVCYGWEHAMHVICNYLEDV